MKKLILSTLVAVGLIGSSSAQTPSGDLANGLVSFYSFNGNANDSSGNGNDLILSNSQLGTDRFGNLNSSLQVDNYYTGAVSSKNVGISGNSDRTISLWIKPTERTALYPFSYLVKWGQEGWDVGVGRSSGIIWLGSDYTSQNLQFSGWYAESSILSPNNLVGSWNNLTVTYNNSQFETKFYINGSPVSNLFKVYTSADDYHNVTSLDTIDTPLDIGVSSGIKGFYDDIAIYNRALSSSEVSQLYSVQSVPEPSTYALFGIGAIGMLIAVRSKKTA